MARSGSLAVDLCTPVDPVELFRRLGAALSISLEPADLSPSSIIARPFPAARSDTSGFRDEYLMKEVLRKYPSFELGIDTKLAAKTSFLSQERKNALTNERLNSCYAEDPRVGPILLGAARKVQETLGVFGWREFFEGVRFGPGSTSTLTRETSRVYDKIFHSCPSVTPAALFLAEAVVSEQPQLAFALARAQEGSVERGTEGALFVSVDLKFSITSFSRWICVPKNATTGRGITKEPDWSIYLQLSLGRMIRRRLYQRGIDLNDQSINQRLALEASITGTNATVDFENASNSLVCALVWQLVGNPAHGELYDAIWFKVLEALRTPNTLVDGVMHDLELFSAMGNGFTFELESLIFWALAQACCDHLGISSEGVSVYGDDVILPVAAVDLYRTVCEWCGFAFNSKKTFHDLPHDGVPVFRESCGEHYLGGVDVAPFYVDGRLDTPDEIILLANNITRWFSYHGKDGELRRDIRGLPLWQWVVKHLDPVVVACRIPYGAENDGLIFGFDEAVGHVTRCNSLPVLNPGSSSSSVAVISLPPESHSAWHAWHELHDELPAFWQAAPYGWWVNTVKRVQEEGPVESERAYIVRLYEKQVVRFSPPRVRYPGIPYASRPGLVESCPVGKTKLVFGRRLVPGWASLGPWTEANSEETSMSSLEGTALDGVVTLPMHVRLARAARAKAKARARVLGRKPSLSR